MTKKLCFSVFFALALAALVVAPAATPAHADDFDTEGCYPRIDLRINPDTAKYPKPSTENGVSTVTITNHSEKGCVYDITLAVYEILTDQSDPDFRAKQQLFDSDTTTLAAGESATLSVPVPACASQADLFFGATAPDNPQNIASERLLSWNVDWTGGSCAAPPETTLTIVKYVVNDNGGIKQPRDFTLYFRPDGVPRDAPEEVSVVGSTKGVVSVVAPGSYRLRETHLPGYEAGSWGGDCGPGGFVHLNAGDRKVCEITNDDVAPVVTPPPTCSPDPEGDLSATILADSRSAEFTNTSGVCTYDIGLAAYEKVDGNIEHQRLFDNTSTAIGPNETVTLSVEVPQCAYQLDAFYGDVIVSFANGERYGDRLLAVAHRGTNACVPPPEPGIAIEKIGPSTVVQSATINYTIRVTNTGGIPLPEFTVRDQVPSELTFVSSSGTTCSLDSSPSPKGTVVCRDTEGLDPGAVKQFTLKFTLDQFAQCDSTIVNGAQVTAPGPVEDEDDTSAFVRCVTDSTPAHLTLVKQVINDNGGTAVPTDFDLFTTDISGTTIPMVTGVSYELPPGDYIAHEINIPGYEAGSWGGDCSSVGTVNLAPGDDKTCVITNNDIAVPAFLTLTKYVSGGSASPGDFDLFVKNAADSTTVMTTGVEKELPSGSYTAHEINIPGYQAGTWGGDCAADGSVSLAPGEHKSCTITNTAIPIGGSAHLTLIKEVVNNNGGTATPTDFDLFVKDAEGETIAMATGIRATLPSGSYTAGEINIPGYQAGSWGGDCSSVGTVNLAPDDDKTCTIVNDDIPPPEKADVSIEKTVTPTTGRPGDIFTYTLTYRNLGGQAAVNTTIADDPTPVDILRLYKITAQPEQGSCTALSDGIECSLGTLAAGASGTIRYTASAQREGTVDNIAVISTDTPETRYDNNEDNARIAVSADQCVPAEIANPMPIERSGTVGQSFSFTFDVIGTEPVAITVTDGHLPDGLSLSGRTISGTPTETGTVSFTVSASNECGGNTARVTITIDNNGGGCVGSCGGGHRSGPKVVLFSNPEPQVLGASVLLSQVPYTGVGDWIQLIGFFLTLVVVSGGVAYWVVRRRDGRPHVPQANVDAPPHAAYAAAPAPAEVMERNLPINHPNDYVYAPAASVSATVAPTPQPRPDTAQTDRLEALARESHTLLSADAARLILSRADGDDARARQTLLDAIAIAKTRYPLEDGWLLINSTRARDVLFSSELSAPPVFVEWLLAGNEQKTFSFLRTMSQQGNSVDGFLRKVIYDIDTVRQARLDGVPTANAMTGVLGNTSTSELERLVENLTRAIDGGYSSALTGAKVALSRILEERGVGAPAPQNGQEATARATRADALHMRDNN